MAYSPEQMRDAFACFADYHLPAGEGSVSVKELASLVRAFGKNPKQEDLQKIVTQIDPSGDGNISFDQFMQVMSMNLPPCESDQELMQAFQAFDKERSGMISERDLATVMRTFGEPLTDEEVDHYMTAAEPYKNNGNISYKSFINFLRTADMA